MIRIGILTMWYNEATLAPFFLEHYNYIDKIHILLDTDTFDNTKEIALKYDNVVIENFTFPDMMDDKIKQEKLNSILNSTVFNDYDWVYVIDGDEFIWCPNNENPRTFLQRNNKYTAIYAAMWQVYQHKTEKSLDINIKPVYTQRRYGEPNRNKKYFYASYIKPCIIKPNVGIFLGKGNHTLKSEAVISPEQFDGSHWAMADVELAIIRRIRDRKQRQSNYNLTHGLTVQHHNITEEEIRKECKKHANDPKLF